MAEFVNEKITVNIHSPLVLYGNSRPEIRANSIKGAMRWWLRALIGTIPECKEAENAIFGSTNGSSKVRIKILNSPYQYIKVNELPTKKWKHDLFYFNYYIQDKEAFKDRLNFDFALSLSDFPDKEKEYNELFYKTLKLFSIFGSLGARSRRGYGSISLSYNGGNEKLLNALKPLNSLDQLESEIRDVFSNQNQKDIDSKFYNLKNAKVFIGFRQNKMGFDSYTNALRDIIDKMQKSVRSIKKDSGYFFIKNLIREFLDQDKISAVPEELQVENASFGFPLSYQSKSLKEESGYFNSVVFNLANSERVASPLLIKVLKLNDKYYQLIMYFKNNIIEEGDKIELKFNKFKRDNNWKKIEEKNFDCTSTLKISNAENNIPLSIERFLSQFQSLIN